MLAGCCPPLQLTKVDGKVAHLSSVISCISLLENVGCGTRVQLLDRSEPSWPWRLLGRGRFRREGTTGGESGGQARGRSPQRAQQVGAGEHPETR